MLLYIWQSAVQRVVAAVTLTR